MIAGDEEVAAALGAWLRWRSDLAEDFLVASCEGEELRALAIRLLSGSPADASPADDPRRAQSEPLPSLEVWNELALSGAVFRAALNSADITRPPLVPASSALLAAPWTPDLLDLASWEIDLEAPLVARFPQLGLGSAAAGAAGIAGEEADAGASPGRSLSVVAQEAFDAYAAGDIATATRLIDSIAPRMRAILASGQASPAIRRAFGETFYNAACYHALVGDTEVAFGYIEEAFTLGIAHLIANARLDADLASLRDADAARFEAALSAASAASDPLP
jgi:hypothetical protein